jgi:N-acetylglucosaminyl-diphospho-decaprenol L-rhamnosyltransferase
MTPDLSVAVVSYNTCGLLRACLASLHARQAEGEARLEIIVADNGSDDGSLDMVRAEFPAVRVIETGGNVGFGRANNLALRDARGHYFCLLNSDAEALPGALAKTLAYLGAHPGVGLAGGQLLWPDGRAQTSWGSDPTLAGVWQEQTFWGKIAPTPLPSPVPGEGGKTSPSNSPLSLAALSRQASVAGWREGPGVGAKDVDQISGAYMVIRRAAWRQVGGFDPAYFMYNEDVDLNVRLRRAGWRVVFLPDALIRHHLGASSRADWRTRARMVSAYNQSRGYYFTRYDGPEAGRRLRAYCLLGAAIRLTGWSLLSLVKPSARDKVKLFQEVWRRTWAITLDETDEKGRGEQGRE